MWGSCGEYQLIPDDMSDKIDMPTVLREISSGWVTAEDFWAAPGVLFGNDIVS